jgi:hypothetical protein
MGAILFGLIYGLLAIVHSELLYWFRIPFTGFAISLACYVASIVLSRA